MLKLFLVIVIAVLAIVLIGLAVLLERARFLNVDALSLLGSYVRKARAAITGLRAKLAQWRARRKAG